MDEIDELQLKNRVITPATQALSKEKIEQSYSRIIDVLKYYTDTTEDNYKLIAMWIIGTYFHEDFNTFPYLFFNAMRGSGKTRMLKLISCLGAKGDGCVQNNLTEAVLFRIPRGTTTCIDEVEQIGSKEKQTLRELLNSAYKKGMKVKRMRKSNTKEGEMQVTDTFEPYYPIAMANINGVEEVLGDRSIVLILEKSDRPEVVMKVEDFDINPEIADIKRTLSEASVVSAVKCIRKNIYQEWNNYIYTKYTTTHTTYTTHTTLTTLNLETESFFNKIHDLGITGRNFELLFPLLLIAKDLSDEIFEDFALIASRTVEKKKDDEYSDSKDVSLFDFVLSLESFGKDYVPIKEVTQRFRQYIGDSDEDDRWLNDRWVGKALKRLNLIIDKRRLSNGIQVTFNFVKAREKMKLFRRDNVTP